MFRKIVIVLLIIFLQSRYYFDLCLNDATQIIINSKLKTHQYLFSDENIQVSIASVSIARPIKDVFKFELFLFLIEKKNDSQLPWET